MSGYPWRVWLAFERRPGISAASQKDRSACWGALSEACQTTGGELDRAEFERWMTLLVEYAHLWGEA